MKNKLPPHVYRDRSRYAFKPYLGRVDGRRKYGRPIRLCDLDASLAEVWQAYEAAVTKDYDTLRWLLTTYNDSAKFQSLSKDTRRGYSEYLEVICRRPVKGGTFGDVHLSQISRRTVRKYLDSYGHPVVANRHVQYIKAAWNWALQRYSNVPEPNPCLGVDLNREAPRDRYVTDLEYRIAHQAAASMRVPYFAPAMELAYLCRARRSEVFGLQQRHLLDDGILLERGKGSKNEIVLWNPRLRAAVEACRAIYPDAPTPITGGYLLHGKTGRRLSKNALDSAWQRVIDKAMDAEKSQPALKESFTFHDLKAKGVSDSSRQNAGGHKSKKMQAVYDRLPQKFEIDYG